MKIECPKCQMRYQVPDEKIKPDGIRVKCVQCQSLFRIQKMDSNLHEDHLKKTGEFVKRGSIEVSSEDSLTSSTTWEPEATDRIIVPPRVFVPFKKELSRAVTAGIKKKNDIISKIKELTALTYGSKNTAPQKSYSSVYAFLGVLIVLGAGYLLWPKNSFRPEKMLQPSQAVKKPLIDQPEIPPNWQNANPEELKKIQTQNKLLQHHALALSSLMDQNSKALAREMIGLAILWPQSASAILEISLWADDHTKLSELISLSGNRPELTELAHIILMARKRSPTGDYLKKLKSLLQNHPNNALIKAWSLNLTIDIQEDQLSPFTRPQLIKMIGEYKKHRATLIAGLPPLYEILDKKIAAQSMISNSSSGEH